MSKVQRPGAWRAPPGTRVLHAAALGIERRIIGFVLALTWCQGKAIINSINFEDGEDRGRGGGWRHGRGV